MNDILMIVETSFDSAQTKLNTPPHYKCLLPITLLGGNMSDRAFDSESVPYSREIAQEIISTDFLLPSADSRSVVVSYKLKYVHEVLVNRLVKLT